MGARQEHHERHFFESWRLFMEQAMCEGSEAKKQQLPFQITLVIEHVFVE